jgi:ketosteroid isomerase-like protein
MSANKKIIENYMDGFNKSDHKQILSCLTDDVEWVLPGVFHFKGKDAFDKEIENPAFEGKPVIVVTRAIEENDIVITEGTVRAKKKDAEYIKLVFCDVFEMRDGLIRRLTSYLMEIK